jgi:hypothetical protein
LLLLIAALAFVLQSSPDKPSFFRTPAPAAPLQSPDQKQESVVARTKSEATRPDHTDAALAQFSAKLQALRETETGDFAAQERLTKDLLALVTDANVEDVVRSLSAPEFDTPFGLAALGHWMRVDPLLAAAWIGAHPDKNANHVWIVASELARDPETLDRYVAEFANSPWKQDVLYHAGRELADRDPRRALALGARLPVGEAQSDLLETVIYSWSLTDPSATLSWIATEAPLSLRERLKLSRARALAIKTNTPLPSIP